MDGRGNLPQSNLAFGFEGCGQLDMAGRGAVLLQYENMGRYWHMRILGVDPGLALMGYGVIDFDRQKIKLVQYGCIETQAKSPTPQRLRSIFLGMNQLIDTYRPDEIAFEELFFARNVTTAMNVGAARGAALVAAAQRTEELYEYTPMQIKLAVTGYGKADKAQVQQMVKMLTGMNAIIRPDDAADAVAVAICHAHSRQARAIYRIK